ncbi:hypothetical protein LG198_05280 [Methylobacillus arboreus]|uniref:hypothetical protein n=1 Tax=Methylobacillus arboreus TaxID=755170 RepID=UPI001E5D999C|nr:hypothetical protein [Methylobacillus arboreus]MCB5190134.1 hypothetical protein [Methylobacillus arboreus]
MSARERPLDLQAGSVTLRMGLHEVQVLLGVELVGHLRFRALGSANSDEAPLYRLQEIQLNDAVAAHRDEIIQQATDLFAQYTGARVIGLKRPPV